MLGRGVLGGGNGLLRWGFWVDSGDVRRALRPARWLRSADRNLGGHIRIGTVYLRRLVERFGGDLHLALAAYHWGPTRVQALRDEHPGLSGQELVERHGPRATARYCREVLGGKALVLPGL